MRWLHITDIHVGKASTSQSNALRSLVSAVAACLGPKPLDAILISGDVSHAGLESEYLEFERTVLAPLMALPACAKASVIMVPGNHDLDCGVSHPIDWSILGDKRQRTFFEENDAGANTRKPRASSLAAYHLFHSRIHAYGPGVLKEVSAALELVSSAGRIRVIGTNTALFSDRDANGRDSGATPAPLASLRDRLDRSPPADYTLIVGHHPIEWFRPGDRAPVRALLNEHRAVYLHGHMHAVTATFGPRGLATLGFGASYVESLDGDGRAPYQNGFSVCEIEDGIHAQFHHWDNRNGKWVLTTELPPEFEHKSEVLTNGYWFRRDPSTKPTPSAKAVVRTPPIADAISSISDLGPSEWRDFLANGNLLKVTGLTASDLKPFGSGGIKDTFIYQSVGESLYHCVRVISGQGHILSRREVEDANNLIDFEGFLSLTIASFGTMADDARTVYVRLATRKPLTVLTGHDLAKHLRTSRPSAQTDQLSAFDVLDVSAEYLVAATRILLVLVERRRKAWFCLIDEGGHAIEEANDVVREFRRVRPQFEKADYGVPGGPSVIGAIEEAPRDSFDQSAYLVACQREFNSARYTALAAVGLRFPEVPLDELYIAASAEVGVTGAASSAISRALDSLFQDLQLDAPLRVELESQLRRQFSVGPVGQSGAASQLYQEHSTVVVLGDPGSGKTCFVKNEVLAYCRQRTGEHSWYSSHIPIFVPLAELARVYAKGSDITALACGIAAKRGLSLELGTIRELVSRGGAAFFFDGLDEVVSIDQRAQLVDGITELMNRARPLGNRFIVTSRPAAMQLVRFPEATTTLTLRGLSEHDMRDLARRVLTARLSEGGTKVRLRDSTLSHSDESLLDELMSDCKTVPGIGRLATNPLLLTLLIMIYANSGRPSAKRHRVYALAVQTLVSVRSRIAGQRVLSEADLRRRLGAVALAAYRDPSGTILTKEQVERCVQAVMSRERRAPVELSEVENFIRDVGEATGLLMVHSTGAEIATVTFMHYSFLEYYAALGLYGTDFLGDLPKLARQPRWREILTLLAGIVSDQDDSSPFVERLLADQDPSEKVTLEMVLFAFDCALECDVPPEHTQRLLLAEVDAAMRSGSALYDADLRRSIGHRLDRLFSTTSSEQIVDFLASGLACADRRQCAAFVDLASHVTGALGASQRLRTAVDEIARSRREPEVLIALFGAIGRAEALRTDGMGKPLRAGLTGRLMVRYAAARAVESAPSFVKDLRAQMSLMLDDSTPVVAGAAASALLKSGLEFDLAIESDRHHLTRMVAKLQDVSPSDAYALTPLSFKLTREKLALLLHSEDVRDRMLGLRLLPWLRAEEQFVYESIKSGIRSRHSRQDQAAALGALRFATGAQRLLVVADVDEIRRMLSAESRDLRISACEVLGVVGRSATTRGSVVSDLLKYAAATLDGQEFRCAIRSLIQCDSEATEVHRFVVHDLLRLLVAGHGNRQKSVSARKTRGEDASSRSTETPLAKESRTLSVVELLLACQQFDLDDKDDALLGPAGQSGGDRSALIGRLRSAARDYKMDDRVRGECVVALACVASPDTDLIDFFVELLEKHPPRLGNSGARAIAVFIRRSRRRVAYVRVIYNDLDRLLDRVVEYYRKSVSYHEPSLWGSQAADVRTAVEEIQNLLRSYKEFAERQTVVSD